MDQNEIPVGDHRRRTARWGITVVGAAALVATGCPAATAVSTSASTTGSPAMASHQPTMPASTQSSFSAAKWGDKLADLLAKDAYGKNAAEQDSGSMYTVSKAIGARTVWSKKDALNRNITGQGVGVAVLDSGVSSVTGLNGLGKLSYGPDLSIESNGLLTDQDTYGHGTFMAGIIGGRGTIALSSTLSSAPANVQLGIAPDARLLGMKLATTDGSTDVSQVIAALDWVSEHPVLADGTRIRVINLSFGTDSVQAYQADPLAAAAENAWKHGIVVVTSAGNSGTATGRVTDPASDPYVLAVGAADADDSVNGWTAGKVHVASFSNVATTGRHVDLIAPGTSLVSLRDQGSYIDTNNPQGLVAGDTTGTLFRGSGTSQAAAVVSGSVALLLQAYPTLTPDQVKAVLVGSADPIKGAAAGAAGAGELNLSKALDAAAKLAAANGTVLRQAAVQSYPVATGLGSLDQARGGSVLIDSDGAELSGEVDVQGNAWNAAAWSHSSATLTAWSGGRWMGSVWTGDRWDSSLLGLSSARWSSARWSSARWSDADWSSARWSSARWSSARWSSARWSSARWSSNDW